MLNTHRPVFMATRSAGTKFSAQICKQDGCSSFLRSVVSTNNNKNLFHVITTKSHTGRIKIRLWDGDCLSYNILTLPIAYYEFQWFHFMQQIFILKSSNPRYSNSFAVWSILFSGSNMYHRNTECTTISSFMTTVTFSSNIPRRFGLFHAFVGFGKTPDTHTDSAEMCPESPHTCDVTIWFQAMLTSAEGLLHFHYRI